MRISVINHSRKSDEEVQRVIRAINRQVQDDFAPHWHTSATIRLEGTPGGTANPNLPLEMRGDAVIYLEDEADVDAALGYHDRNLRGIPFGFVFLDLCRELEEPWSVTLSHEVLELIVDPEVNRLVAGPHPEDSDREVLHWYEVCDAVQDERYEIDGVEVSNFVLPLYFTGTEEMGGRNDFLGTTEKRTDELRSFGVAKGGYIGYYDPLTRTHETVTADDDARRRMEVKNRAKATRRSMRYRDRARVRAFESRSSPTASPTVELESLAIRPTPDARAGGDQHCRLKQEIGQILGRGFDLEATEDGEVLLVMPTAGAPPPSWGWEAARRLADLPCVLSAEPQFRVRLDHLEDRPAARARGAGRRASSWFDGSAPDERDWHLQQVNALRAHELFADTGREPGEGIRIGQPDTGYTDHPELRGRFEVARGKDYVHGDGDARDDLEGQEWHLHFPGHGTATASVLASPQGSQGNWQGMSGVAPGATIVPLRTSRSVVLLSMTNLARAIRRAVNQGCHVISISMGGPLTSSFLQESIDRAIEHGVIVCAAAGNYVGEVVFPARLPQVVAVAGSDVGRSAWWGSSRGDTVDVTAPGENVWRAEAKRALWSRQVRFDVRPSSGTSYSVAATAGAAALWLSLHGREALIARYGRSGLASVFQQLVRQTASRWHRLPRQGFGAGVLDIEALLKADLAGVRPANRLAASAPRARPFSSLPDSFDAEIAFHHALSPRRGAATREVLLEQVLSPSLRRALR